MTFTRSGGDGRQHEKGGSPQNAGSGGGPPTGRRKLVVELIVASDHPVTIAEIADRLDVHPNTVRFHLDGLVASGQVERLLGDPTGRGRPPQRFRRRQGMNPGGPRSYRLLAEIGLSTLADDPDPAARAVQTGRAWGGFLIDRPAPAVTVTADQAVHRLLALLDDVGFSPQHRPAVTGGQIELRNCPFLELVAQQGQQIICPLHLGLMQGAMAALDAHTTVDRLEPFAQPGLCLAHLSGDPP